jgi:hypothetical protein
MFRREKFEYTKGVIRNRISKKDRQYNGKKGLSTKYYIEKERPMFITSVLVNNVNGTQQLQNQNSIDGKLFRKKIMSRNNTRFY